MLSTLYIFLQFDSRSLGNEVVSKSYREELEKNLNDFHSTLVKVSEACHKYLTFYDDSMKAAHDGTIPFLKRSELMQLHQNTNNGALAQV